MVKELALVSLASLLALCPCAAQKFTTERGQISFFSDAPIEDIEAVNTVVGSMFNTETSEIVYIVKIRDFVFPKALMREHFNEKYLESEKFPKASFQGKINGFKPDKMGVQQVSAVGKLSIHGITKDINVPGTMELSNNKLLMKSKFMVNLADHNIKIPTIVWQNIAEDVQVTIDFIYKPI
jgi:hypothetical protein